MPGLAKFLIGFVGVGIVTWLFLGPFGHARTIADDLESRTLAALDVQGAGNITARVPRRPVRRVIYLSGDVPQGVKRQMSDVALELPGVGDVVWNEQGDEGGQGTARAVADCQQQLSTIVSEDRIQFRSGSAYLNPASNRLLDRLAEAAGECDGMRIAIAGHTDNSGTGNVNREISAFRATAVRDALVERGISADILTTEGRGSSEPLGDNPADPVNRRIEFTVSAASEGDAR